MLKLRRRAVLILTLCVVLAGAVILRASSCTDACDAQYYATLEDNPGGYMGYTYAYAWAQWLLCVERCAPPIEAGLTALSLPSCRK